jgi:hypothetical protein
MADGEKVADPWGTLVQRIKEREADKAEAAAAQKEAIAQHKQRVKEELARIRAERKAGGGSGGSREDRREAQLGADLDPKAMMKKEGYKAGGKVKSASARADGCAIRGKTRA